MLGSIRSPASCCGVVVAINRLRAEHLVDVPFNLDLLHGTATRNIGDTILLQNVLSAPSEDITTSTKTITP